MWNRAKLVYDAAIIGAVFVYVALFMAIGAWTKPPADASAWIDLRIKALGTCAFLMLTVILCIGPLARLDARALPLLYNRRHLGVATFLVAALHATAMLEWYVVQGVLPSLLDELTDTAAYGRFIGFPFKVLGIAALAIMALMAATSHDYWLALLGPRVWKALHMAVYAAYGFVVMHVALGAFQSDRGLVLPVMVFVSLALVAGLHLAAARRERLRDDGAHSDAKGWLAVGPPGAIPDKGALIVTPAGGERIAVFRDGDLVGAMRNVCAHQCGPVGEGRIIDGLITCPWHGWQYRLEDGRAPPPFEEKLVTHRVRLRDGIVEVDPAPLAPGTPAAIRLTPS